MRTAQWTEPIYHGLLNEKVTIKNKVVHGSAKPSKGWGVS